MSNDESRRLILARRARFMAATLAGLGVAVACGGAESNPEPCLSQQIEDGGKDAQPQACLAPKQTDAGADAGADAEPQVCLSIAIDAGDGGDGG